MFLLLLFVMLHFGETVGTFSATFGGSENDIGYSVQEISDGGFIVVGYTESFGNGSKGVFLSKFNFDGSHNWTTITLGESGNDYGFSVQEITRDGGFIVTGRAESFGDGISDVLLSKFNNDGSHNWTTTFGGNNIDVGFFVQETSDGGFIVVGETDSFGIIGVFDVLLSKFNNDGSHNWTTTLGGGSHDFGFSVRETSDGGFIVTGYTESFGDGIPDVLLSKFNNDGSHNWTTTFGGSYQDVGNSVQETSDGSFIVVGETFGSFGDGFLGFSVLFSKFNSTGGHIWTKVFGGIGDDFGFSVQETIDEGYIVTGYTESFRAGSESSNDVFLSKFNFDGSHNWTTTFRGSSDEHGRSVQETSDGGFIVTGFTESFGAGSKDVLLSKFDVDDLIFCEYWDFATIEIFEWDDCPIDYSPNVTVNERVSVNVNVSVFPIVQKHNLTVDYVCFSCFGLDSNSDETCYGIGNCSHPDTCHCKENHFGQDCSIFTCDGIYRNITSEMLCSGHGNCTSYDHCVCFDGYYDSSTTFCQDFECDGILFRDKNVCSGHGDCISPDQCICNEGFEVPGYEFCESWYCFDVVKDSDQVCSGHGVCVDFDECLCIDSYGREDCSFDTNLALGLGLGLSLGAIFVFACFCCSLLFCFVISCGFVVIGCCGCCLCGSVLMGQIRTQKKKIERFAQLKDFDLLLKEQEMEQQENFAKLKINKELFSVDMDDIRTIKILGEGGSNSIVLKAEWVGKIVAYKCFKTRLLMTDQDTFDDFEREVEILSSLAHPHRVGILMEYCSNGEILEFVLKFREDYLNQYPIPEKIRLLIEVCSALEYIHSKKVIHRDLKCENVLISENKSAKLMDFGLSRAVERMSVKKTSRIGTSCYMAPELVTGEEYDEKCDIFSLGIMMYILLKENPHPYGGVREEFQISCE